MYEKQFQFQYLTLLPKLQEILETVRHRLSNLSISDFIFESNIKPIDSIIRKSKEKQLSNIDNLSDLVRGRIYFSKRYTFQDVKKILRKIFGSHIKEIEKKNEKNFGLEYQGITHVDMEFDGINFELQVIPIEFKPFKEFLHRIYEQLRSDHANSTNQDIKRLRKIHNRMMSLLTEIADKNRK